MQIFVITPAGVRVTFEELGGHLVQMVSEEDEGALRVLNHMRESKDAEVSPELAALIDAMLAEPGRAKELVNRVADEALARFAGAAAIAYQQRTPGASLDMVPEGDADAEFLSKRGLLSH